MPALQSTLEINKGVPVLTIGGKPVAPMMAWGANAETSRHMAANGFHLYTTPLPMPWPRPGFEHDFSQVDAKMEELLANDRSALTMPRVGVEPPGWWKQAHPEEMPVWENGKSDEYISVTSKRWLGEVGVHIRRFVEHLERKWGDRVFAYHPCALNSGEWYYASTIWECHDWGLRNYDASFAQGFREWLEKRYGDLGSLNTAWHSAFGSFAEVRPPPPGLRRRTAHGLLRNPVDERPVVDFSIYQSVAITDAIRHVARVFKDAADWKKLVYIFYGYTFELAGLQEGIGQFGHLDLDSVLDDPAVDVWCAPSGYFDRRNGGSGPVMGPAESCIARGRAWCNEDDLRTHLSRPDSGWGRVGTEEETLWAHRRNFMASFVRRSHMWFMDQGGNWLESPAIWQNLAPLRSLYEEFLSAPAPLRSDVAVVVDEPSLHHVAYGVDIGLPLLYDLRADINRMGTTPELWLQSDYLRGRVTGKKLVIFLNAFALTQDERKVMRSLLAADNAAALWFYAPGALCPDAASASGAYRPEGIEGLTGIRVAQRDGERSPAMKALAGHSLAREHPADTLIAPDDVAANLENRDEKFQFRRMTFPQAKLIAPLYRVDDPAADVFGHYADTGEPAMARKDSGGFTGIFVGGLALPARILGNIAREAGAHLYCDPGDVVYTDGKILSYTACSAGAKTVRLPAPAPVTDLYGGQLIARGDSFALELKLGETRVFRIA